MSAKRKPKTTLSVRPFETDYAGAWKGRCKTRAGAVKAAVRHLMEDGYSRCTITEHGAKVARMSYDPTTRRVTIVFDQPIKINLRSVK